jgi:hypothetical protein
MNETSETTPKKLLVVALLTLLVALLRLPAIGSPLDIDEGISFLDYGFSS